MIRHKDDIVNAVKGVDNNATPCHRTGYDKHNIRTPATQEKNWRKKKTENKTKKIKREGERKKGKKDTLREKKKRKYAVVSQRSVVSGQLVRCSWYLRLTSTHFEAGSLVSGDQYSKSIYLVPGTWYIAHTTNIQHHEPGSCYQARYLVYDKQV